MITKQELLDAQRKESEYFDKAHIFLTPEEKKNIEGANELDVFNGKEIHRFIKVRDNK